MYFKNFTDQCCVLHLLDPFKKLSRILKIDCRSILFGNFFAAAKFWSSVKNVKTIASTKGQWTSASHSIKSSPRKCIFLLKITEQQFVQRYFHNYDVNNWDNVNASLLTLTSISINKPHHHPHPNHHHYLLILTRPKSAWGWQGLAGGSLRASGAQLGSGKWSFFVTYTQTNRHFIIIYHISSAWPNQLSNNSLYLLNRNKPSRNISDISE